jgi:hypothetical protein
MDAIQQFNRLFPEFMDKFDAGDKPMVVKLISEIFKYPFSNRVYLRMGGYKAVPRHAFNDCNPSMLAIDSDLERFAELGLAEKTDEGWKLII